MDHAELLIQLQVAADLCRANGHLKAESACVEAASLLADKSPPKSKPKKEG